MLQNYYSVGLRNESQMKCAGLHLYYVILLLKVSMIKGITLLFESTYKHNVVVHNVCILCAKYEEYPFTS